MKNNRISNLAEFRRWVKIRLVEKEISQNELARQMGIPHARISEATHGKQSGKHNITERKSIQSLAEDSFMVLMIISPSIRFSIAALWGVICCGREIRICS